MQACLCAVAASWFSLGANRHARSKENLWWLLGTSVYESDGCALDFFMFSELWHSQIKEHKSISRVYLYHAEQTLFIFSFGGS